MMSLLPLFAVAETSVVKKLALMEKMYLSGQHMEAMDSAVSILAAHPGNRPATNFIYTHWDEVMREVSSVLASNTSATDVDEAIRRLEVYRLMAEMTDFMAEVDLPLHGPNDSWVWYPELYYNQGDYDTERTHVYRLLVSKAMESLQSYDAEEAKRYYLLALHYLLPDTELTGNLSAITQQLYRKMKQLGSSSRIPDAIFAYELTVLSLALDTAQPEVKTLQQTIQAHVSDLYVQRAAELRTAGDTVKALEYMEYSLDWKP